MFPVVICDVEVEVSVVEGEVVDGGVDVGSEERETHVPCVHACYKYVRISFIFHLSCCLYFELILVLFLTLTKN